MNLSFQEKSLWISLVSTLLIFGYYFSHAVRTIRNPDVDDMILVGFIIGVIVLTTLIQIILQSVLAIAYRKEVEDGGDERDNLIELKANRISYFILVFGVWVTGTSLFISPAPLVMAHIIIFFFVLAEIVGYATQLIYYRRGF